MIAYIDQCFLGKPGDPWASDRHTQQKENQMATIHVHQTTSLTPEQYVAALTDFGPGRSKLFDNSADDISRYILAACGLR